MGFMDKFKDLSDKLNEQKQKQNEAAKAGTLHPGAKMSAPSPKAAAPAPNAAPKAGPVGGAAAGDSIKYGEVTKIKFGTQYPVPYHDMTLNLDLYIKAAGDGELTMMTQGAEMNQMMAKSIIIDALQHKIYELSKEGVAYDQLPAHRKEIMVALDSALREKGVNAKCLINTICADQRSQEMIENHKKKMAYDAMSPDDMAKKMKEAMAQAQATANAAGAGAPGAGTTAAFMAAAASEKSPNLLNATCPSCGAPAGIGKFCQSCGAPLGR